jgi:two-component system sensor histidine kinase KdpD
LKSEKRDKLATLGYLGGKGTMLCDHAVPDGPAEAPALPLPLAFLAHELRSPLATLHGAAQTLARRRHALDDATQGRLLHDIAAEAERLTHLVEDLLELCRGESRRPALTEPVALRPLVRRVLRALRPMLSQHRVARRLPPGLPPVEADPIAIEHILRNLLDNAARYSPPGSLLTITARSERDQVLLRVADRGPGIPAAERERVFAPFVRLPRTGREPGRLDSP